MINPVTAIPPATSTDAVAHFQQQFAYETDCWDTHESMQLPSMGFVLLDVRSPALYRKGHLQGAINLPHGKIVASKLSQWSMDTMFVSYCAGPHCNGAARAAVRLANLGRPVKIMVGGISGWRDEGFELVTQNQ